jgi:pimeloyl-ACP methyl ester carboxylesterase
MPSGQLPEMWKQTLETHNLIWIGANRSGNDRGVGVRFGLALDAVHNIRKLYKIDDSRIYVAGFSGGGKVAGMLGMIYPEVFQGAIPMGGVGFYRTIPVPNKKGMVYPNTFDKPPKKMFELARTQRRFVLLIGDQDFNFEPVSTTYETGFKEDQFTYASLLVVPGLEHRLADETWLEKAIMLLDSPLADQARELFAQAVELEKQQKFADAYRLYLRVSMHGGETLGVKADDRIAAIFEHARLEMVKARGAADAKQYAQSATILLKLRETYGDALPPEVEQLLAELRASPESAAQIKAVEDRAKAQERQAVAQQALETAQALVDQDVRRGYEALRKVASDYPNTPAATAATTEADRLLSDPKIKAQVETDPVEVEARKQLNLAQNYRRNKLYPQARQRLESLITTYPTTKAAAEAKALLEQLKKEEAAR